MNKQVQEKWVAALTSGEYTQGSGALLETKGGEKKYCCLGVLCDLYIKEKGHGEWKEDRDVVGYSKLIISETESQSAFPTNEIYNWSGLDTRQGIVLANLNDIGQTFAEIAEVIKTY